jgi:hypothetical protein
MHSCGVLASAKQLLGNTLVCVKSLAVCLVQQFDGVLGSFHFAFGKPELFIVHSELVIEAFF